VKNILIVILITLTVLFSAAIPLNVKQYKLKTVVLDAGHGGKDPGCSGKSHRESIIALDVVLALGEAIKKEMPDVKVIYTRSENKFVELHDRAAIANKNNADLFISIHCNAGHPDTYGSESYTMGLHTSDGNLNVAKRENAAVLHEKDYKKKYDGFDPNSPMAHILLANYQHAYIENSLKFASKVEDNFKNKLSRKSRGVKQAGFLVLWKTSMPASLIEIGYLSNSEDEKLLSSKEGQTNIANAIADALKKYKQEIESSN
jgi:N-acetylmuramoyl-L-alanine amidase